MGVVPTESGREAGPVLAVASFTPLGPSARSRPGAGRTLRNVVHSHLASARGVRVVTREKTDPLFREQRIRASGFTEPEDAVNVGRVTGAQYVVTGSYELSYSNMYVNATIYDVETGTSVGAANLVGANTTMRQRYRLGRKLSRQLLFDLGVGTPVPARENGSYSVVFFLFMGAFVGAGALLGV